MDKTHCWKTSNFNVLRTSDFTIYLNLPKANYLSSILLTSSNILSVAIVIFCPTFVIDLRRWIFLKDINLFQSVTYYLTNSLTMLCSFDGSMLKDLKWLRVTPSMFKPLFDRSAFWKTSSNAVIFKFYFLQTCLEFCKRSLVLNTDLKPFCSDGWLKSIFRYDFNKQFIDS